MNYLELLSLMVLIWGISVKRIIVEIIIAHLAGNCIPSKQSGHFPSPELIGSMVLDVGA
jgi:hypothetical protein